MRAYENILVAVDLAADNRMILAEARDAGDAGSRLAIVHVMEPIRYYSGLGPSYPVGVPTGVTGISEELEEAMLRRIQSQLDQLGEDFGIDAERRYLEHGHPATRILELAVECGADLIVLGSHGRYGMQLLLGSTANAVLHRSSCDVLAVRIDGSTE